MQSRYKNSYLSHVILYISYYASLSLFGSVMSVYLKGIGIPDQEMSLILSAAGIFSFFICPIFGFIVDISKNQKALLAVILCLAGGLALVFSACRGVAALFLLNGAVMSLINCISPVCERVAGESRFRYGTLRVWGTIGYAAGTQFAGLAIEKLPGFALFALVAGTCILCLIGLLGVPVSSKPANEDKTAERPRLRELLDSPQFFLFLGIAFMFYGCAGVNMNYSPVLLSELGVPTGMVGTMLSLSTLVEIPLILFSNKFMDRLSPKTLTAICFLLTITQYLVYGLTDSVVFVVTVLVLLKAISTTLYMMLILKMVRCLVPAGLTTTGLAVVGSVNSLAGIVLQNVSGWAVSVSGMRAMYLGMAVINILGLMLTGFLRVRSEEKVFG